MKKTILILTCLLILFALPACKKTTPDTQDIKPVTDDTTTTTPPPTTQDTAYFNGEGFTFSYPMAYTSDENGLWTEEGYENHINPPEQCSTCHIPLIEVKWETTSDSPDQFIINDFTISEEILEEMSEQVTVSDNDFTKITVSDMFDVTGYYTKKDDLIVAFRVYWNENDNEELQEIISTLEFQEDIKIIEGFNSTSIEWGPYKTDIQEQTEEAVSSFSMPPSHTENNIIYVSTQGEITGQWPDMISTNKIYLYNTIDGKLNLLYEEKENRILRTMGIEGPNLIIMYDLIGNSPGPCFSVWAGWDDFGIMDINNSGDGLSPYTVPEYKIEEERITEEECNKIINP